MRKRLQTYRIVLRLGVGFVLLLLLVACTNGGDTTEPNAPTPTPIPTPIVPEKPTYTVEQGTVVNTIDFTGRVSPVVEQELFFRSEGFVDQLFVQRGDEVSAGDVLAQLEISDLENQLAQAEVALQTAVIKLEQAEEQQQDDLTEAQINLEKILLQLNQDAVGTDTADRTQAEIDLENAQQRLVDAQYELQKSLDRHWEPEDLRKGYERDVEAAEENLAIAQARYNDVQAGGTTGYYDRQLLVQDRALAELKIAQLERGIDPLLELDVQKAQLDIEKIEQQIADAQLTAPFDGQVLSVNVRPGDSAEAFKAILVLAQPDALEVTADLGSEQLSEMSVGQIASVTLRNRPEETFGGIVRQLPYAFSGGATSVEDDDQFVRVAFDDPDVALELGELATVVIVLEEKEDVLWLPPSALRSFQGRDFVVIQDGDGQRRVDVRLGIESDERIEILEGVAAGQTIVGE